MSETALKSIQLMVNRQERTILVRDIIYAQVEDKLCTIYLVSHPPVSVFLAIASLKAMLPKDQFLQISRNCLVALCFLQNVNANYVILTNGIFLPYSHRQKAAILHTFQKHLSTQAVEHENRQ